MSKIDELIKEYCPNEVEYKELGALGNIENIGVDKKIISGQQKVRLLNYMDIYRNQLINTNILNMEVTASENKIKNCNILKGDIFITPTSETLDDIGHSAVAIENIENAVYSYHIMRYRLNEENIITSCFINYLFRSEFIQSKILKRAKGITRFGVSKKDFERIKIPIPHIQVQEEIVRVLDKFTNLIAELEAELENRKKQYKYYKNELLDFSKNSNIIEKTLEWRKLEQLVKYIGSGAGTKLKNINGKYNLYGSTGIIGKCDNYTYEGIKILIARVGANSGNVNIINEKCCISDNTIILDIKDEINTKYIFYYLENYRLSELQHGGGQPVINTGQLKVLSIPIPLREEQERIVAILDKFDKLVNDMTNEGLPAEIEKRKQQYEYYRNKLLTFDEVKNNV